MKRYWLFYGDSNIDWGCHGALLDLQGFYDTIEGAYVDFAMAPNNDNWCIILDVECREIVKVVGLHRRDIAYLKQLFRVVPKGIVDLPKQTQDIDLTLNFAPPYKPIPLFARSKFIPANGQKPVRSKFNLKDFIVDFFNKHL